MKRLAAEDYSKDKANAHGDPHRFEGITADVALRIALVIVGFHISIAPRILRAAFVLISNCPGLPPQLFVFCGGRLGGIFGGGREVLATYLVGGLRLFFYRLADCLGGFGGRAERLLGVLGAAAQFFLRKIGCLLGLTSPPACSLFVSDISLLGF